MDMIALARMAEFLPGGDHPGITEAVRLTIGEFLQLGLFRMAYLTEVADDDGVVNVVLHGADGMAIAAVETTELADDLADQLGLALVSVH